jgi:hypothetical protein
MPKFSLGQVVATPGALAALQEAQDSFWSYLQRHSNGDWGEVNAEDAAENELSLRDGFRLLSAYTISSGIKIWMITERDRSATTILLPEEYWLWGRVAVAANDETEETERLRTEIAALRTELENLRRQRDEELARVFKEMALDRQRLTRLETPLDPTPSQKDRSEILRALLAANEGKMPEKEARQKMHLSKSQFSQLLASMNGGIELKPYHLDRRQKILILK